MDHVEEFRLGTPMTLRLDRSWLSFPYAFSRVLVRIGAEEHSLPWGTHTIALPPGETTVKVRFRYLGRTVGEARAVVPACTPYLEYKAPLSSLVRGDLAPAAKRHGVVRLALLAVAAVILVGALVNGVMAVVAGRL